MLDPKFLLMLATGMLLLLNGLIARAEAARQSRNPGESASEEPSPLPAGGKSGTPEL